MIRLTSQQHAEKSAQRLAEVGGQYDLVALWETVRQIQDDVKWVTGFDAEIPECFKIFVADEDVRTTEELAAAVQGSINTALIHIAARLQKHLRDE